MDTDTLSSGKPIHSLQEEQQDGIGQQLQDDDHSHQDKSHHQQQKTLALIKPDAMQANHQQAIIDKIISSGFTILQQKQVLFDLEKACLFYREHEHKSFYSDLTEWMASAPIYAMVLEKENAIQDWRSLMGPTNSIKAREIDPTSIRALFGTDGSHNATHGSDCLTSAEREIAIVFGSPQESSATDIKAHHDQSTINTSSAEEASSHSIDHPSTLGDYKAGDLDDFTENTNTIVSPPSSVDVEHPGSTPDVLSHHASSDAPTCPISDSVEPSSCDESATVIATETDIGPEESDVATEVQSSTIITTSDNNDNDGANETEPLNSIVDETPEQNKSDSLPDSSSPPKQDHQENPVTETIPVLNDHFTTETALSNEVPAAQRDKSEVLEGQSLAPVDDYTATADAHTKDGDDNTQPETNMQLENEEKVAGDHDSATSHVPDTIDKTKEEAPVTLDTSLADGEHENIKILDDNHDLTPEQETESLAIKEEIAPVITDSVGTTIDAEDHHQHVDSTTNNEHLTTHDDDTQESVTLSTNDDENDRKKDEKEIGLDIQDTLIPVDQEPSPIEEHQNDIATGEKFDTIPLVSDAIVSEEHNEPVMDTAVAVMTEEVDSQVSKPAVYVETSEPVAITAVEVVAEETAGQDTELIVSVVESEPVATAETVIPAHVDDIAVTEEHVDPAPTDVVPVVAEFVEEPLPAASTVIEEEIATKADNEESPVAVINDDKPVEQHIKDEQEHVMTKVDIVDEDTGATGQQDSDVETPAVKEDQSNMDEDDNDRTEPSVINSRDVPVLATDESEPVHDNIADIPREDNQNDAITTDTERKLTSEDAKTSAMDHEHQPEPSNQSAISTDNEETTVRQAKSVSSVDEEEKTLHQDKSSTSDEFSEASTKEKEVVSPSNKSTSPTRSPTRKPPTSGLKAPTKIGTAKKVPGTTATDTTKSNNTIATPATTRLRRPGTTTTSGTATATGSDKPSVKKATGLKSSASPGRTPLPRVATLAKKSDSAAAPTNTTETKPAIVATKKRSSVINRLTAPTAASANKRTSDTASTTTKAASGNGTTGTHRAKATSGTTAPTTRRTATATTKSVTEKAPIRRTSPSSTADKPTTTRRISPPTSTTLHANKTSARSSTTTSSRVSSSTAASKSPSPDHAGAKRAPVRRISPPSSTHPSTATKPTIKSTAEKKGDVKRKVATKPSGTKPAIKKDTPKQTPSDNAHGKPDAKGDEETHTELVNDGENVKFDEKPSVEEHQEPSVEEHQESPVKEHQEPTMEEHQEPSVEEHQAVAPSDPQEEQTKADAVNSEDKTSLKPTTTQSRPKTPELAQLRNKFETLQTTVAPTRSSNNKPSSAPHNIKDLISRFN